MEGKRENSTWDNFFEKIEDYIGNSVERFVAFIFFIVTIGSVMGYFVGTRGESELLLVIMPIAGLLAYNNRAFAIAGFVLFLILIILL
ncbi:MAG: hypothetical protein NUV57_04130 [archaeon]|nr:hypothetical protein [archaeon]